MGGRGRWGDGRLVDGAREAGRGGQGSGNADCDAAPLCTHEMSTPLQGWGASLAMYMPMHACAAYMGMCVTAARWRLRTRGGRSKTTHTLCFRQCPHQAPSLIAPMHARSLALTYRLRAAPAATPRPAQRPACGRPRSMRCSALARCRGGRGKRSMAAAYSASVGPWRCSLQ